MKKMIIIILITFIFLPLKNKELNFDLFKEFKELVLRKWNLPIYIAMNETSNFDEKAINKKENAAGLLQIRPIMIRDVNRIVGYKKYTLNDRYNFSKSLEIFYIIQDHYNPEYDIEKAARIWNGGPDGIYQSSTINYYNKFLKNYNL